MTPTPRSTPRKRAPAKKKAAPRKAAVRKVPPEVPADPPATPVPEFEPQVVFTTEAPPPLPTPPPEEPSLPAVPWRWWESLVVFLLALAASLILIGIISSISQSDVAKATGIVAFEVALGGTAVLWVKLRFGLGLKALGVRTRGLREDLGAGVVAGLVGIVFATLIVGRIVVWIADHLSSKPVTQPEQLKFDCPSNLVLAVTALGVLVAAPIAEELFFRGFVFQGFRRRFSLWPSAVLSGAMFGLAHVPFWLIMPSIASLGIVLAVVFDRRASVVPTMVAHATFNTLGFIAYLVTQKHC